MLTLHLSFQGWSRFLTWRKLAGATFGSFFVAGMGLSTFLIIEREELQTQTQTTANAYQRATQLHSQLQTQIYQTDQLVASLSAELASTSGQLQAYLNRDEYLINQDLEAELKAINLTYQYAVATYEEMVKARDEGLDIAQLEKEYAKALSNLADRQYGKAKGQLDYVSNEAENKIQALKEKRQRELAQRQQSKVTAIPATNTPPTNGYQRQRVNTPIGSFNIDIIAGDLNSTRVLVDTASKGECANECPVLSVGEYANRTGAYAAINGSYFCPATYPSCVGKSNSFDTLLMNRHKTYFNSDNNKFSTVPAVIFGDGWVRFVGQSLEWGRDTSIDSMIANQPLLVSNGQVVFTGDGDPKKGSKSNRSFVASKGSTVFIGVVWNATVAEAGYALASLGMDFGLNLDAGGSTAFWVNGSYKAGPGRNVPNAIVLVRK